jgi:hypothetical protein
LFWIRRTVAQAGVVHHYNTAIILVGKDGTILHKYRKGPSAGHAQNEPWGDRSTSGETLFRAGNGWVHGRKLAVLQASYLQ